MFNKIFSLLLMLTLSAGLLSAEESINSIQKSLDSFISSPDHRFAPATAAKAQAYLGGAMLADERKDSEELSKGLETARTTITAALATAAAFKEQFPALIKARNSATETIGAVGNFDPLKEPNPKRLMQDAETALDEAVTLFESGDLNRARVSASQTTKGFKHALNAALPALLDRTGSLLADAVSANAKNYAPKSYKAAKDELLMLEQYVDGLNPKLPQHPVHALQLAERALEIARQVKIWRKDSGSHEGMLLKSRSDRIALARALAMDIDDSDPRVDVSSAVLTREVKALKDTLEAEKAARSDDLARLESEYAAKLEQKLEEERATLLSQQSEQMSGLKEAFRAKLERETFESNRQKQIRAMFKKGEVETLVNLDGSLLVRLTSLKFASGSSKIDPTSYDLLGKLKNALEVYGDRNVRIEGHTDSKGDVKINQKISLKRAEAVRDFLIAASMDGSRLKSLGYGEVRPIASNEFKKGRAMNRRIDVVIEAQHD